MRRRLRAADDGPITHVIVTHAHADHYETYWLRDRIDKTRGALGE
jgi:glyoxylase-like metal-dependent hydrolase (beta-lactamase superfamily II)